MPGALVIHTLSSLWYLQSRLNLSSSNQEKEDSISWTDLNFLKSKIRINKIPLPIQLH